MFSAGWVSCDLLYKEEGSSYIREMADCGWLRQEFYDERRAGSTEGTILSFASRQALPCGMMRPSSPRCLPGSVWEARTDERRREMNTRHHRRTLLPVAGWLAAGALLGTAALAGPPPGHHAKAPPKGGGNAALIA